MKQGDLTRNTHGRSWDGQKNTLGMEDEESHTLQNMKEAEQWDEEDK